MAVVGDFSPNNVAIDLEWAFSGTPGPDLGQGLSDVPAVDTSAAAAAVIGGTPGPGRGQGFADFSGVFDAGSREVALGAAESVDVFDTARVDIGQCLNKMC